MQPMNDDWNAQNYDGQGKTADQEARDSARVLAFALLYMIVAILAIVGAVYLIVR